MQGLEEEKVMGKEKWFYRLLKRLGIIKTRRLTLEEKAEMCNRSVMAGVCPADCDRCTWGWLNG